MTFGKYMDASLCCFIPGKIMDEIYNVLRILKTTSPSNSRDQKDAPRTYEVLQVSAALQFKMPVKNGPGIFFSSYLCQSNRLFCMKTDFERKAFTTYLKIISNW